MAAGFFALLDDVGMLLDDVASASKIATRKAIGLLGDDLAVNAEQATGFEASRELPIIWKITKGAFVNKLILIPIVFLLQFFFPPAIVVALTIGGFYLSYEGVEKIMEFILHKGKKKEHKVRTIGNSEIEENKKVKSAIITDFVLSIEIVIIALSSVLEETIYVQIITVFVVSLLAIIIVYGIVALIVRMDDAGLFLIKKSQNKGVLSKIGHCLIKALPKVIKLLEIIGTIALLLVSGGLLHHYLSFTHNLFHNLPDIVSQLIIGFIAGIITFIIIQPITAVVKKRFNKK